MTSEINTYKADQDPRLTKFFKKLISETVALKADRICFYFTRNSDGLGSGVIEVGDKSLRKISIKEDWYQPLIEWMQARNIQQITGKNNTSGILLGGKLISFEFSAQCLLDKTTKLVLKNFTVCEQKVIWETFGVMESETKNWLDLFEIKKGVVLLSANDRDSVAKALALFLVLSGWTRHCPVTELNQHIVIDNPEPIVVTCIAQDQIEALTKLNSERIDHNKINLSMLLQIGFVRKVCSNCARKTTIQQELLKSLPQFLANINSDNYLVGRGCKQCGETGYSGVTAIQSAVAVDVAEHKFLLSSPSESGLVEYLWKRGAHPILEVGIKKAFAGETTLESVFSVTKFISQAYLDYEKQHGKPECNNSIVNPTMAIKQPNKEKLTLVLVEDDPDQREILEIAFQSNNYRVISVANGQEGVELLNKIETPDIIVSDLMMPVMDGAQFVQSIKSNNKLNHVPILMFTVVSDEEKEFELLNLGADDYCEKSVSQKILMKRVERLIART